MYKRLNNYCTLKYKKNQFDVDIDEVMELLDSGYGFNEIAKELNVSKEQVNMLQNEINKYY